MNAINSNTARESELKGSELDAVSGGYAYGPLKDTFKIALGPFICPEIKGERTCIITELK